jgi:flavin prenyltransferase
MRLILGISGASGAILGVEVLKALKQINDCEVHLVITQGAEKTLALETGLTPDQLVPLGGILHPVDNLGSPIASGSFRTDGMVVVPCSMKTVAGIATGYSDNLLLRAADVCLKEKRKLVLVPRDAPLSGIHLRNQYQLSFFFEAYISRPE